MPRELSERDIALLKILAPEFCGESCTGSGMFYRSILPPVANHYASDAEDFRLRISRLDADDIEYLVNLVMSGEESLHCISPEFYEILEKKITELLGDTIARRVAGFYAMSCD
jgi:hypothetical protein